MLLEERRRRLRAVGRTVPADGGDGRTEEVGEGVGEDAGEEAVDAGR